MRQMSGSGGQGYGMTSADRMRAMYEQERGVFQTLQTIAIWFLRVFSLPLEVFFHTGFGVRYLTPVFYVASMLLMVLFWGTADLLESALGSLGERAFHEEDRGQLLGLIFGAYGAFGLYRIPETSMQHVRGIRVHTRYSGAPWPIWFWLPFGNQEYTIKRLWEPLVAALAAGVLWSVFYEDIAAWYIWICAAAMATKNHIEYVMLRGRVYDMIDAQIDAEELRSAVLEGREPREVRGSMVGGIVRQSTSIEDRARIVKNFGGQLSPKLNALLEGQKARPKVKPSRPSSGIELGPDPGGS